MMKMLTAAAILSLSLTGASWAQSSDGSGAANSSDSGSQQNDPGDANTSGADSGAGQASETTSGDLPRCPPGQKSVDPTATKGDPTCIAE